MGDCYKESALKSDFPKVSKSEQNFYEILEIPVDATKIQVREAYIRLKSTYSNGSQALYSLVSEEDAKSTLENLEEAYRVLYDEILRKDYDQNKNGSSQQRELSSSCDDPFHSGFGTSSSGQAGAYQPSVTVSHTQEELWPTTHTPKKTIETAKKMRFSDHALDTTIQEKIRDRLVDTEINGQLLKDLRDIQGVSLNELQDRTKVSLQYIIALENNDFHTLPSVVYVKGFLKICLQYLGVQDGIDSLVNQYLELIKSWRESKGIEQF